MKNLKKILFGMVLFLPLFIFAAGEKPEENTVCKTITAGGQILYYNCGPNDHINKGESLGASYNEDTNVLTIENGDLYFLRLDNFDEINVIIKGETVINATNIVNTNVTFSGDGVLYLGYDDSSFATLNSKITFDNINVVVGTEKRATPPSGSVRSETNIIPTTPYQQSLLNIYSSIINFKKSTLSINTNLDYGIYLAEDSELILDSSDVRIVGPTYGIFAEDNGIGIPITDYGKVSSVNINNSVLYMDEIGLDGLALYEVNSNKSNISLNGSLDSSSNGIGGLGKYTFVDSNVKLSGFGAGIVVTNEMGYSSFSFKGGLLEIDSIEAALLFLDAADTNSIDVNNMVVMEGHPLIGYNSCYGEGLCVKTYTFGVQSGDDPESVEYDKKISLKNFENIKVIEGQGQSFYEGTQSNLMFKIDRASLEYFEKILLNGEVIDANDYTIEGDTVTISQRVISKLAIGDYVITVKYTEGEALVNLSIIEKEAENPFTGSLLGYIVIAGMILLICTAFIVMKHSWVSE